MNRGLGWATVHGVAKSQTRLSAHACKKGVLLPLGIQKTPKEHHSQTTSERQPDKMQKQFWGVSQRAEVARLLKGAAC